MANPVVHFEIDGERRPDISSWKCCLISQSTFKCAIVSTSGDSSEMKLMRSKMRLLPGLEADEFTD